MTHKYNSIQDNDIPRLLQGGKIGVLPSDTLYGLMVSAAHQQAIARLYAVKQRDQKPGTLIAANIEQLVSLGIKRKYLKAVEHLWPNPLSIIIPCPELSYLHLGRNSLAIRIPNHPAIRELLHKTGPLQTTSANMPGDKPAATLQEAIDIFGNSVDFYVDGGDLSQAQASTIIRIDDDAITIIRPGACPIDEHGNISNDDELVV